MNTAIANQNVTTTKEIHVSQKHVYGKLMIYPVCEQAKLFARIANSTTLTSATLTLINKLGYKITVIPGVLNIFE